MVKLWDEVTRYLYERKAYRRQEDFKKVVRQYAEANPDSEFVTSLPTDAVVSCWGLPRELEPPRLPRLSVILGGKSNA